MKQYGKSAPVMSEKHKGDEGAFTLHENITSLFQPDTTLADQYFDNLRRKTLFEPEKRLMLAVLEDGINCFQGNLLAEGGKAKRVFEDAQEWILERDKEWVFSFENICEALGFDPRYIRKGLLRWKQQRLSKPVNPNIGQVQEMPRYAVMGG